MISEAVHAARTASGRSRTNRGHQLVVAAGYQATTRATNPASARRTHRLRTVVTMIITDDVKALTQDEIRKTPHNVVLALNIMVKIVPVV